MIRKYNYTNRIRIPHKNIMIFVNKENGKLKNFEMVLDIYDYNLPKESRIYVEAYHRNQRFRYDFGNIGNIDEPDTSLEEFMYIENIHFRVLITQEKEKKGLIIALADGLSPVVEVEDEDKKCILPVWLKDLENKIWSVTFEIDRPYLIVNKYIHNIKHIIKYDNTFFFYVYPQLLKEIILYLIYFEEINFLDPIETWHNDWIEFIKNFSSIEYWPESIKKENVNHDDVEIFEWIENISQEFAMSFSNKWQNCKKVLEE